MTQEEQIYELKKQLVEKEDKLKNIKLIEDLKSLLLREANYFEDNQYVLSLLSINLNRPEDKKFLKEQFITMRDLFDKAIKELEVK